MAQFWRVLRQTVVIVLPMPGGVRTIFATIIIIIAVFV